MQNKGSVLITGASRGIGAAIARLVAKHGFLPVLNFRQQHALAHALQAELLQTYGVQARCLPFDVANYEASKQAIEQDIAQHGAYFGLVLNAGVCEDAPFPALSYEAWSMVMKTNLDSFYHVVHPALWPMIQARTGGRIVVMSSLSAQTGNRGQVHYSAAKAGLIGAVKALSLELAKRKITVNVVSPGLIDTDMLTPLKQDEAALQSLLQRIPMQRLGTVEEAAASVGFLLSPEASYITGQVLGVNGGVV